MAIFLNKGFQYYEGHYCTSCKAKNVQVHVEKLQTQVILDLAFRMLSTKFTEKLMNVCLKFPVQIQMNEKLNNK